MELLVLLHFNVTILQHLFDVNRALAKLGDCEAVFDQVLFGDEPLNGLVALPKDLLLAQ